jgi:hypothetical protein
VSQNEKLPALNTDRELWREKPGDYYSDSIHVTEGGGIGLNCGGCVIVMPIRKWHALAEAAPDSVGSPQKCPTCGSAFRETYFGKCAVVGVKADPWHDSVGEAPAAQKETPDAIRRLYRSLESYHADMVPCKAEGCDCRWHRAEQILREVQAAPAQSLYEAPPTVADALRLLRKIENCSGDAAKLILLKHFREAGRQEGWEAAKKEK